MAMRGVSPPRATPLPVLANNKDNGNITVAFRAVIDAPDLRTWVLTAVNDKDNKESKVSINTSNRLHNAEDVAPMRIRAVISCGAKSFILAYFQRVNWPLNNILPWGEVFVCGEVGNIVKEFGLSKAQVSRQLLNYKRERFGF